MTAPCSTPDCPHPASARGLCSGHYARLRAGRPVDTPLGRPGPVPGEPQASVFVRLPRALKLRLEARALGKGVSVAGLIRGVVEEWLRYQGRGG